jgi:hypothetical protein
VKIQVDLNRILVKGVFSGYKVMPITVYGMYGLGRLETGNAGLNLT